MEDRWSRWAPLTGIVAVLLVFISAVVAGDPPDPDESATTIQNFYAESDDDQIISSVLLGYGAFFLALFGSVLRVALDRGRPGPSRSGATVFAGALIMSVGLTIWAGLGFALGDSAEDLEPAAVQAINAISTDMFMPVIVGGALMLWGSASAILRRRTLPRGLGIAALILAIPAISPIGFFALLGLMVWIIVVAIYMLTSGRQGEPATPPQSNGLTAPTPANGG